ncbi:MAG: hypothetical protein KKC46_11610 [Proteobacteria bacterium]|nr:hypothetical protein [Pseudomonadota bacterium]
MKKKTIAGLLVAFVIFACFVLWLLTGVNEKGHQTNGGDYAENLRRSNLAISLKVDAEEYYKQHKQYPQIAELYPSPDILLIDYLKSGVISYGTDKTSFCVRYINSDQRFQRPGQKYAMSWNGKQYCSKKEHLLGVSEDWQADSDGFYIHDLH